MLAVAATALAVSVAMSGAVLAKKNSNAAKTSRAEVKTSLNDSFNRCVSLARSRGFTGSDLEDNRASARKFVLNCMQGKQH
jgi:hypothetical protein